MKIMAFFILSFRLRLFIPFRMKSMTTISKGANKYLIKKDSNISMFYIFKLLQIHIISQTLFA